MSNTKKDRPILPVLDKDRPLVEKPPDITLHKQNNSIINLRSPRSPLVNFASKMFAAAKNFDFKG